MAIPEIPLHEKIDMKTAVVRTLDLLTLFLLLTIVFHRILYLKNHGIVSLVAFLCELWFTFIWILNVNAKWNPIEFRTYPDRLLERRSEELPAVDMFVTTADPALEPPILTVNTVLSLLAVDYPSTKLACYVSDDAASPLTYFSITKGLNFARLWVPFCKKHAVQIRAPFRYFSTDYIQTNPPSPEFQSEREKVKVAYDELRTEIDNASKASIPCDLTGEYQCFSGIGRRNHRSIIKVIWENHGADDVPHLVYVSREKQPKQAHHYKAGAMNVLTRVSGTMTNAPITLNVDCDMYAHNPQVILHAMCLLLGFDDEINSGFVQFPQHFYGGAKDEPIGNQLKVLQNTVGRGFDSVQGPLYSGTGCFHRRKCIYGAFPGQTSNEATKGALSNIVLRETFGNCVSFIRSVESTLEGQSPLQGNFRRSIASSLEDAILVSNCNYETSTAWGQHIGWLYGSATEDVLTGIRIHARGWRSLYCRPGLSGFLGCVPFNGPPAMIQQKRWASGLMEVLFGKHCPLMYTVNEKLMLRQCMNYLLILSWPLRSVPDICYAALPVYAIISRTALVPPGAGRFYLILFIVYNLTQVWEYLREGCSITSCFNSQRMSRITPMTAWFIGLINTALKLIGLSDVVFEVTLKEAEPDDDDDATDRVSLTFDKSPVFISGTSLTIAHLVALFCGFFRRITVRDHDDDGDDGVMEMIFSILALFILWPFVKGLVMKGKRGIPSSTICKSVALVAPFVAFSLL